jgi:CubicO group peptidase (beta-lactamase class C family)/pimeloyl-ACP methyl ester carboxylesterase
MLGTLAMATSVDASRPDQWRDGAQRDPRIAATKALFADVGGVDQPGCAVGVRHNSRTTVNLAQGSSNIEQQVPITSRTVFDVGSVSKQFTAASVQLLAADRRLALADDIRSYVPELPDYGQVVTIEQLIHHTGGFGDYARTLFGQGNEPADVVTDEQALAAIAAEPELLFAPGTQFSYSNSGYFLLSLIAERVSGVSLNEFASERIFQPLGMVDTRYQERHDELIVGKGSGYKIATDGSVETANSNWEPTGDGAVQSTIGDMLLWAEELSSGERLGADLREAMVAPGPIASDEPNQSYASGLYLAQSNGHQVLRHAGSWYGYTSDFEVVPELGFAAVALCNIDVISSQIDPEVYTYPGRQPQERLADVVDLWTKDSEPRRLLRVHGCADDAPAGAECSTLTVPEQREGGNGRMINIETMVLPATNGLTAADPLVFLDGGPGGAGIASAELWATSEVRRDRDIVLLDQRGTGTSQPALNCDGGRAAQLDSFVSADPARVEVERIEVEVARCFDTYRAAGIDPDAFNTAESADDVADLASALDAPGINVYGVSYGTRLALEVARSHGDIVRSTTIDSVSPPDAPGVSPTQLIPNGEEGFERLFAACADDAACAQSYGDLHSTLDELVIRYNQQPQPVSFEGLSGPQTALITGNDMATVVWYLLGNGAALSQVPAAIDSLAAGDTTIISEAPSAIAGQTSAAALGTQVAVDCNDGAPPLSPDDAAVVDGSGWRVGIQYFYPGLFCEAAGTTPLPDSFREPVETNIPVLVLGGAFDPITSSSGNQAAADQLENSTFVEIADGSHFVVGTSACARSLLASFVNDPHAAVDTACRIRELGCQPIVDRGNDDAEPVRNGRAVCVIHADVAQDHPSAVNPVQRRARHRRRVGPVDTNDHLMSVGDFDGVVVDPHRGRKLDRGGTEQRHQLGDPTFEVGEVEQIGWEHCEDLAMGVVGARVDVHGAQTVSRKEVITTWRARDRRPAATVPQPACPIDASRPSRCLAGWRLRLR